MAYATATCPDGFVVLGGGGRLTGDDPYSALISEAFPLKEPDRFSVTYVRYRDATAVDFGTQITAYAICVSMDASE